MTQTPTCESEALLQAYLDDELSADERAQVDAHVAAQLLETEMGLADQMPIRPRKS